MVPYALRISAEQRGRLREAMVCLLDRGTFAPEELAVTVAGAV
ncbi:Ser/Thr protein kinase RdoA involved in Cpx stress response, MazF antagonist OS=Streptomyces microflavus OX=1919 GN=Smic_04860 PE=4 SV=1 [Streptomyces microflavus]